MNSYVSRIEKEWQTVTRTYETEEALKIRAEVLKTAEKQKYQR